MLSHVLPYVLYVAPPSLRDVLPEAARPWLDPVRVTAAGAAFVWFAAKGAYPELRRGPAARPFAAALALASGLVVAGIWMPLSELGESLGISLGTRGGFDPGAGGEGAAPALWAFRIAGFALVTPFVEELFVRSLVPRWTDAMDDWRTRPVGVFTALSACVSIAFFTGTHPELLAAFVTAILWTWLVAHTRRLGDVVAAHAVANGVLAAVWALSGDRSWW